MAGCWYLAVAGRPSSRRFACTAADPSPSANREPRRPTTARRWLGRGAAPCTWSAATSYPRDWVEGAHQQLRPIEKGIDVALAVDLVRLGMEKAYDAAIVMSGDKDLLPALETVYDLKLGHVELAAWTGCYRLRFAGTQLPWCHWVSEAEFRTVEDDTDYTRAD